MLLWMYAIVSSPTNLEFNSIFVVIIARFQADMQARTMKKAGISAGTAQLFPPIFSNEFLGFQLRLQAGRKSRERPFCSRLSVARAIAKNIDAKTSSSWFWGVLDQCSFNIPYHLNIRRNWLKPVESGSCSRKQKSLLKSCRKASRKANDLEMRRRVREHTVSSSSSLILSF